MTFSAKAEEAIDEDLEGLVADECMEARQHGTALRRNVDGSENAWTGSEGCTEKIWFRDISFLVFRHRLVMSILRFVYLGSD